MNRAATGQVAGRYGKYHTLQGLSIAR